MTIEIGQTLRRLREEHGYTLSELAKRTELSISYLSEIERNHKTPSVRAIDRLASALGVSKSAIIPQEAVDQGLSLGDKLRLQREEHQLTLNELALRAGISASHLSDIERGQSDPSVDTLRNLARVLELPVSLILSPVNTLGEKVRMTRETLGLSRKELAERSGISPAMVAQVESGVVQPSLKTVEKLAAALGVTPCFLVMDREGVEEMIHSMGPDLRQLLLAPNVHAVLRSICHLEQKQLRFILHFIDLVKRSEVH
ncbi:MAG: helix-turn-helix domain-containing protein [Bacillota bacterium]